MADYFDILMQQAKENDERRGATTQAPAPVTTAPTDPAQNLHAEQGGGDYFSMLMAQAKANDEKRNAETAAHPTPTQPVKTDGLLSAILANAPQQPAQQQNKATTSGSFDDEKPTLGERIARIFSGSGKQFISKITEPATMAIEANKGTLAKSIYEEQLADINKRRGYLAADMQSNPAYAQNEEARSQLAEYDKQIADLEKIIGANEATASTARDVNAEIAQSGDKDIERAKQGLGKAGSLLVDVTTAGTQMAMDAATGGLPTMAVRSFGGGAQEARAAGATRAQQTAYGFATAATEVLTEKLFGGNELLKKVYGGGMLDKVGAKLTSKLASSAAGKTFVNLAKSFGEEALEEMISDAVNPIISRIYDENALQTYTDDEARAEWLSNMLYDGLVGGSLGLLGGAVTPTVDANTQQTNAEAPTAESAGAQQRTDTTAAEFTAQNEMPTEAQKNASTEEAESTAVNDNPAEHTPQEQAVIEAYKANSSTKLRSFIEKVRSLQNQDYKNRARETIDTTTERAAEKAKELTGVETAGYSNVINGSAVQHIDNRHGINGAADHSMADIEDFSRIGFVLDNFTNASIVPVSEMDSETAKLTKAWRNSDNTQAPLVRFSMPVNGTYYVVEAVPSSKAKVMAVVSAYMENGQKNSGSVNQVLNMNGNPPPQPTPNAMLDTMASTDNTVPQAAQESQAETSAETQTAAPENHIDNRTSEQVGKRSVNAFQFDHPQLHPFFVKAAQVLKNDAENSMGNSGMFYNNRRGEKGMQYQTQTSRLIDAAQAEGISRPQIVKACEAIINNHGQENYAVAKRVELILNDMLTNGYRTSYGEVFEWDADYIAAKSEIKGGKSPMEDAIAKYDAQYETTDALEAPDEAELARREADRAEIRRLFSQEQTAEETPNGMGAANAGFAYSRNALDAAENQYGKFEGGVNSVREDNVPKKINQIQRDAQGNIKTDDDGMAKTKTVNVSETAKSAKGAAVTPEDFVPLIENKLMESTGKNGLTFIPITNSETVNKAENGIIKLGWDDALAQWQKDVYSGKTSAEITATGAILYNNAVNAGNTKLAMDILSDYAANVRNAAQALQAARIMKKMTPESRLYMIQKAIRDYGNKLRGSQHMIGEPFVFEYSDAVGTSVANSVINRLNLKANRQTRTFLQQISAEISKAANEKVPKDKPLTKPKKADFVRDYLMNKEFFDEAYRKAQEEISRQYLDNGKEIPAELADIMAEDSTVLSDAMYDKLLGRTDLKVSDEALEKFASAKTDAENDAAVDAIAKEIAKQLPSTLGDKWTALRYTNMLGNFKTQGRNIAGNVGMQIVSRIRYDVAAAAEGIVNAVSGGKLDKTKAFLPGKDRIKAARDDFKLVEKIALGEGKYAEMGSNPANEILRRAEDEKTIFKFGDNKLTNKLGIAGKQGIGLKTMEAYRKATNWAMEKGDVIFSRASYAHALSRWMKAKGITAEQWNNAEWQAENAAKMDDGRAYAIKEAQNDTFRDSNAFSDYVSKIGRGEGTPKAARIAAEGLLPFRKTPANVLVRAEEYSPLGVINTAVKAAKAIKGDADVTGADVIDQLSKTLTGTGLFAAGIALALKGVLRGGDDDDDRQQAFDELTGHQNYSVELPDGTSYTMAWITPGSIPLFMGAELAKAMEDGDLTFSDIEGALTRISEPMLQMSMLSGVNDTLDKLKFSNDNLGQLAISLAVSYLTQGLTNSLVGQGERISEKERMSTYTDSTLGTPAWLQKLLGKASAKTPGWEYHQYAYIDQWGQKEDSGSLGRRAFENLISPGYLSKVEMSPLEKELQRLADKTGSTTVFPGYADKSFEVKGETLHLNQYQYTKYATKKGQMSEEIATGITESAAYKSMDDEQKADAIKLAYEYANAKAKMSVSKYTPGDTSWLNKAFASDKDPADYIADYVLYGSVYASMDTGTLDRYNVSIGDIAKYDEKGNGASQEELYGYLSTRTDLDAAALQIVWDTVGGGWKTSYADYAKKH